MNIEVGKSYVENDGTVRTVTSVSEDGIVSWTYTAELRGSTFTTLSVFEASVVGEAIDYKAAFERATEFEVDAFQTYQSAPEVGWRLDRHDGDIRRKPEFFRTREEAYLRLCEIAGVKPQTTEVKP